MKGAIGSMAIDDRTRLRRRILYQLRARYCMRVDELCLCLGETESLVREEIEDLLLRGDVERIRPVGYEGHDRDAYAIPRAPAHASRGPAPRPVRAGAPETTGFANV